MYGEISLKITILTIFRGAFAPPSYNIASSLAVDSAPSRPRSSGAPSPVTPRTRTKLQLDALLRAVPAFMTNALFDPRGTLQERLQCRTASCVTRCRGMTGLIARKSFSQSHFRTPTTSLTLTVE